jgi:hypothetical protein
MKAQVAGDYLIRESLGKLDVSDVFEDGRQGWRLLSLDALNSDLHLK